MPNGLYSPPSGVRKLNTSCARSVVGTWVYPDHASNSDMNFEPPMLSIASSTLGSGHADTVPSQSLLMALRSQTKRQVPLAFLTNKGAQLQGEVLSFRRPLAFNSLTCLANSAQCKGETLRSGVLMGFAPLTSISKGSNFANRNCDVDSAKTSQKSRSNDNNFFR